MFENNAGVCNFVCHSVWERVVKYLIFLSRLNPFRILNRDIWDCSVWNRDLLYQYVWSSFWRKPVFHISKVYMNLDIIGIERSASELIIDMCQNKRRCGKILYTWERKEKEENIWRMKKLLADQKRLKNSAL